MAAWNLSKCVDGRHRDNSGSTSRPPLPRLYQGDNVCPVPLWERQFCCKAYDIPWEKFCRNKWFIGLYKNVMDWDDSEAFKNFQDAKERYRAKYHGEPYEDPVIDPDIDIDKVDSPYCIPNTSNNNLRGGGPSMNLHQQGVTPIHMSSGPARMLPSGGRLWIGGNSSGSARNCNVGGGGSSGGGDNGSGRNRNCGGDGGRNRNGGGNSGGASGFSWNCFGRGNQMNQTEGQHGQRNSGGMQRNHNDGQHQMMSGSLQQQGQGVRKTKWYLVPPKDFPAA